MNDLTNREECNANLIFSAVLNERVKQNAKWGEQNHPSVEGETAHKRCENAGCSYEEFAKVYCEIAVDMGKLTWALIAGEELSEAVSAEDDAARRVELVQLAAVVFAWIDYIDRRAEKADGA